MGKRLCTPMDLLPQTEAFILRRCEPKALIRKHPDRIWVFFFIHICTRLYFIPGVYLSTERRSTHDHCNSSRNRGGICGSGCPLFSRRNHQDHVCRNPGTIRAWTVRYCVRCQAPGSDLKCFCGSITIDPTTDRLNVRTRPVNSTHRPQREAYK